MNAITLTPVIASVASMIGALLGYLTNQTNAALLAFSVALTLVFIYADIKREQQKQNNKRNRQQ